MIVVTCDCGETVGVSDDLVGTVIRCPACHQPVSVSVFVPSLVIAGKPPPDPKRPFWKDPIVVVGSAIPALILAVFFGYLSHERSEEEFRGRINAWKAKADRLALGGQTRAAYDAYKVVVDGNDRHPTGDPQLLNAAALSRSAMLKLEPLVAALVSAEQESDRVLRWRAVRSAELAVRRAERALDLANLSRLKADVTGTAWVEYKSGSHTVVRGTPVYLLRTELPLDLVAGELRTAKNQAEFAGGFIRGSSPLSGGKEREATEAQIKLYESFASRITELLDAPPAELVDLKKVHELIRLTAFGTARAKIVGDELWPKVVAKAFTGKAETSIEGRYSLGPVPGGEYYVYALYQTEWGVIEWMFPLRVEKDGPVVCDLHNNKAFLIVNEKE
jgi:hypothetical protein